MFLNGMGNMGEGGIDISSSSFHAFPESKWATFTTAIMALSVLVLPVSAIFHYLSYPFRSSHGCRSNIMEIVVC